MIRRNPDTQVIVDHLCLVQPHAPPVPAEPWRNCKGAHTCRLKTSPSRSQAPARSREPYPFNDIWDPVCRVIDAFGIDRCLWGTDGPAPSLPHLEQGVDAFRATNRISESDKAKLMGANTARYYGWSPTKT